MVKQSNPIYKLESDINDFVKNQLINLGLKKHQDFNEESAMSDYLKEALKGAAKTENKTNFGKPDFHIEKYSLPVIIENKLGLKKLISSNKDGVKFDDKSISNFAVNGALHYARSMIASEKYSEVIAIGVAGDNSENIEIAVYYVFGSSENAYKRIKNCNSFHFLENEQTFKTFYQHAILSEQEKHDILIKSQEQLRSYAKRLNKLMHNLNITAPHRVLYVSGMLLAMQPIVDKNNQHIADGLTPDELKGSKINTLRDGQLVKSQIDEFLSAREIDKTKKDLMMSSFSEISKDPQRDEAYKLDNEVAKWINGDASINKQIFTFIYECIFKCKIPFFH